MLTQNHWINSLKSDCNFCHQLGNQLTRDRRRCASRRSPSSPRTRKRGSGGWAWACAAPTCIRCWPAGQGPIAQGIFELDRAHCRGRSAAGAAPADGHRAQRRSDPVGRGRRPLLHARSDLHGQEPSHRERRRQQLRGQRRSRSTGRARIPAENSTFALDIPDARSQGQSSLALPGPESPLDVLGQRASVGQSSVRSGRSAQSHARQQGPRVDDLQDPRQPGSRMVQRSQATSTPIGSRCATAGGKPRTGTRKPRSSR